jgi:hypothetical protein
MVAWVGVAARWSATSSAMVVSLSCPIAATIGRRQAWIAAGEVRIVEAPEILDRAAAAGEQDGVDGGRAPRRGGGAVEARMVRAMVGAARSPWTGTSTRTSSTAGQRCLAVSRTSCSAAEPAAGEHRDPPGKGRDEALGVRVEPAPGAEVVAEGAEAGLEGALAVLGDGLDDEREPPGRGVILELAGGEDGSPVGGLDGGPLGGGGEHDRTDDGVLVLEVEIVMRAVAGAADLAPDGDLPGEGVGDRPLDEAGERGDGHRVRPDPGTSLGTGRRSRVDAVWIEREAAHRREPSTPG